MFRIFFPETDFSEMTISTRQFERSLYLCILSQPSNLFDVRYTNLFKKIIFYTKTLSSCLIRLRKEIKFSATIHIIGRISYIQLSVLMI